ncbi:MAG: LamG-like jellyroll fold domain-containing protein [Bacteroidia bacterium]
MQKIIAFIILLSAFTAKAQVCGGSLFFDSTKTAVNLPLTSQWYSPSNGGYTWECWFKLDTMPVGTQVRPLILSVDNIIFEDMYLGFGWNGGVFNDPPTQLMFRVDGPNSTFPIPNMIYAPPGGFLDGVWYHTAGVMNYNTQTAKLFLNGQLVATSTVTAAPITRTIPTQLSCDYTFSWASVAYPLFGNMDEVRIWDRPLTDNEIGNNYNTCLTGNEQNLILYYHCNLVGSTTVADATANVNTGTFQAGNGWSTDQPAVGAACQPDCPPEPPEPPIDSCLAAANVLDNIPNVFSPNGDGRNDQFFIQGLTTCLQTYTIAIYDRWGAKVFESSDPLAKWDGIYKDKALSEGVYVYTLSATFSTGKTVNKSGNITLMR